MDRSVLTLPFLDLCYFISLNLLIADCRPSSLKSHLGDFIDDVPSCLFPTRGLRAAMRRVGDGFAIAIVEASSDYSGFKA